jgi:uncharacterized coiled-coil protein SlyX
MNPNEELIKIYEKEINELNEMIIDLQKSLANKRNQCQRLTQGKESFENQTMLVNDFEFQPKRECLIFKTSLHIAPDSTAQDAIEDAEKQKDYYLQLAQELYGSEFDEEGTIEVLSVFPSKNPKTKEIIGWNAKIQYNFPKEEEIEEEPIEETKLVKRIRTRQEIQLEIKLDYVGESEFDAWDIAESKEQEYGQIYMSHVEFEKDNFYLKKVIYNEKFKYWIGLYECSAFKPKK